MARKANTLGDFAFILAILPIHLAVMVSPGPNFVLLSTTALSTGRPTAVRTAFGITTGSMIWMTAAALGIAVILEALPALGMILKVLGAIYLIYLGLRLWRSAGITKDTFKSMPKTAAYQGYWRGLLVNLTSPKSAAYFGSIFAAFLTGEVPWWVLVTLIACLSTTSILWHVMLAVAFSSNTIRSPYLRFSRIIDRIAGTVLILLGLRMMADAR